MINHISIKNFALIKDLDLDLHNGLNILTGETGSGKSIIFTAISLALGARAEKSMIRTGEEKAIIQMTCDYLHEEYVIIREITAAGKNLCKINGEIVTLGQLNEFASKLASVHGQYDNQYLLNPSSHIHLIDLYDKKSIKPCKENVAEYYSNYVATFKELKALKEEAKRSEELKEKYGYQIEEIQNAKLIPGEAAELKAKLVEENNKEKIAIGFAKIYEICNNDELSLSTYLSNAFKEINEIKDISKDANELENEFIDLKYRLDDVLNKISNKLSYFTYDSNEIKVMEERLTIIDDMKRKYGNSVDDILAYKESMEKELHALSSVESEIEQKQIELERYAELLKNETKRLSYLRNTAATSLESQIQRELSDLNLENTVIKIQIEEREKYTSNGIDDIEILISTNKGESLKPLAKIASGGEISRIMLAFKNVIGQYDKVETLIFDEIDSGISGQAATTVANKLQEIAGKHQVISITHLPQIAAAGNHNYKIYKVSDDSQTYTHIDYLSESDKAIEIARLLSGSELTEASIQNAKELISSF